MKKIAPRILVTGLTLLLQIGCGSPEPTAPDPATYSVLTKEFLAAPSDDLEGIKRLLQNGAEANAVYENGRTRLWSAAWDVDVDLTKLLLDHGANPNIRDADTGMFGSMTPLHALGLERAPVPETYKEDSAAIADLLIAHGANVNTKNAMGITPLDGAASTGMDELVAVLQKHGAEPNCDPGRNPKLSNSLCKDE